MTKHDHGQEALDAIDAYFAAPPVTITDAVAEAILKGRMTVAEGAECIQHWQEVFQPEL